MGEAARKGLGVQRDLKLARTWYQLSAEQEYAAAMIGIAATFRDSARTPENFRLMMSWLRLAADNGRDRAAFVLAGFLLIEAARGRHEAEQIARTYLEKAAPRLHLAREVLEQEASGRRLPLHIDMYAGLRLRNATSRGDKNGSIGEPRPTSVPASSTS